MGVSGRGYVRDNLAAEQIVGTDDSTIPGQKVDTGSEAQAFANGDAQAHARGHGRPDLRRDGPLPRRQRQGHQRREAAAIDPKTKQPVENGLRNMWVNETALATALNTAYFAEQVATFAIVMGIALLLAGLGFGVLSLKTLAPEKERVPGGVAVAAA